MALKISYVCFIHNKPIDCCCILGPRIFLGVPENCNGEYSLLIRCTTLVIVIGIRMVIDFGINRVSGFDDIIPK